MFLQDISFRKVKNEVRQILRLGFPLVVSHTAVVGMEIIDTMMAGQVSAADLGGLAVGVNIWFIVEMVLIGLISAITPRIARFWGANDGDAIRAEAQHALVLGLLLGLAATALLLFGATLLDGLGTEAEVTRVAEQYLTIIAYSMPALCVLSVLLYLCEAHGLTRIIMITSLSSLALNALLDYVFVFGTLGMPAMGGVGCAWTTTCIYWLWLMVALTYVQCQPQLKQYRIFTCWPRFDLSRWRAIMALGLPISLAFAAEEGFFNVSALLIAPLGTASLGAHQITIQIAMVVLMISFGVGQATSIRIAQSIGKKCLQRVAFQALVGMGLIALVALVLGIAVFVGRDQVLLAFTRDLDVIAISSTLLLFAPLYLLLDAFQAGAAQTLRGFEDTKWPMIFQVLAYWGIGFPLGYSMGATDLWGDEYGVYGFWAGFLLGISVGSILLCSRLWRVSRGVSSQSSQPLQKASAEG